MILERVHRERLGGCREEEVLRDDVNPKVGLMWFRLDFESECKRLGIVWK